MSIERPIFLSPILMDGSETLIPDNNTSVVVTSPHAPGVELDIPAGTASFSIRGSVP